MIKTAVRCETCKKVIKKSDAISVSEEDNFFMCKHCYNGWKEYQIKSVKQRRLNGNKIDGE